jgi:hypothetical protein
MGLGWPTILSVGALRATGTTPARGVTAAVAGGAEGDTVGDVAAERGGPPAAAARDAPLGLGSFIFGSRLPSAHARIAAPSVGGMGGGSYTDLHACIGPVLYRRLQLCPPHTLRDVYRGGPLQPRVQNDP